MLNQIDGRIRFSKEIKKYIREIKNETSPLEGKKWGRGTKKMIRLKKQVRSQLMHLQNEKCAYCGLPLNDTSSPEIEHIAPKGSIGGRILYPQFMFTPFNLVLACSFCNGPLKKGTKDTITYLDINYRRCDFNIYHPYFNNPADHFQWIPKTNGILILPKTDIGETTIKIFGLDTTRHVTARVTQQRHELAMGLPEEKLNLLDKILGYKSVPH